MTVGLEIIQIHYIIALTARNEDLTMTGNEEYIKNPRVKYGYAQQLHSADFAIKSFFKKLIIYI